MTWNEVEPAALAEAPLLNRLVGYLRIALAVLVTAICALFFLAGRGLRSAFGGIIVFHFGAARFWARACVWLIGLKHDVRGAPIANGAVIGHQCTTRNRRAANIMLQADQPDTSAGPEPG
ncbi:MAG: hypothetical protein AAF526_12930, partial [Pseudomonadota bacterium]